MPAPEITSIPRLVYLCTTGAVSSTPSVALKGLLCLLSLSPHIHKEDLSSVKTSNNREEAYVTWATILEWWKYEMTPDDFGPSTTYTTIHS